MKSIIMLAVMAMLAVACGSDTEETVVASKESTTAQSTQASVVVEEEAAEPVSILKSEPDSEEGAVEFIANDFWEYVQEWDKLEALFLLDIPYKDTRGIYINQAIGKLKYFRILVVLKDVSAATITAPGEAEMTLLYGEKPVHLDEAPEFLPMRMTFGKVDDEWKITFVEFEVETSTNWTDLTDGS
jgi:hypothetical protein